MRARLSLAVRPPLRRYPTGNMPAEAWSTVRKVLLCLGLVVGMGVQAGRAQDTAPLDGPQRPFRDSLFDRLTGTWFMSGAVGSQPAGYTLQADWVLNHQFLRLEMRDTARAPAYEAIVFIGRDNLSERYVAHWLDVFGGRWSETLGYGTRAGQAVEFVFEYPDGPFRTTFAQGPGGDWSVEMRQRTPAGTWRAFAHYTLQRR